MTVSSMRRPERRSTSARSNSTNESSGAGNGPSLIGVISISPIFSIMRIFDPAARLRNLLHRLGIEIEQLRGVAAEDVALGGFLKERQIVNRARQVEVPMRIIGRPDQLSLRIDHLEGRFQDREIVRNLHRLR